MVDLDFLHRFKIISDLDYYFALILCRTAEETDPVIRISAALTSRAALNGNVCLDLDDYAGKPVSGYEPYALDGSSTHDIQSPGFFNSSLSGPAVSDQKNIISEPSRARFPVKSQWIQAIKKSSLTGNSIAYPLVYDGESRLYLARYYDFQQRIVENIVKRIQKKPDDINMSILKKGLDRLFPGTKKSGDNTDRGIEMQKKAAMNAVLRKFAIISGGPGTGKTFIIEKIIALLEDQANAASKRPLRVMAAAPTGKAASKLKMGLTIHRMLGAAGRSNKFRYNKDNPLACDLIIIDEASMIDIALMTRLLEAVPEKARFIMLGDKNQLASVEAGAVFGDICRAEMISDVMVNLEHNFRSGGSSGIDRLAKAVKTGDTAEVENILSDRRHEDICFVEINNKNNSHTRNTCMDHNTKNDTINDNQTFCDEQSMDADRKIMDQIIKGYLPFIKAADPGTALEKFNRFRILCAHRKGRYGTDYFNAITEKGLRLQIKEKFHAENVFYKKPVMINVNNYNKELFNGDTGIAVRSENNMTRVFFKDEIQYKKRNNGKKNAEEIKNSGLKSFLFSDLPSHEDAFAMTVHKSQGSEFDHVLFALPSRLSPVVTRELLYTGITRAKKSVTIAGTITGIKEAVSLPVQRNSAITELIDRAFKK